MRRKIIKQGNHSYTLTMPVGWIREQKLESGGEVEIMQEDNSLLISLPKDVRVEETAIRLPTKDYNERTLRNILNQTYRKGYDKIILLSPNKEQLEIVRELTRNTLMGFEVISESSESCTVQKIAEPSGENFDSILRKIFFYIEDDSKEILEEFQSGKIKNMKKMQNSKDVVDNYTNLCRRLIIKEKISGTKNSYLLFTIVSYLSLIHHAYYYMYKFASSQKNLKISKETLELLEQANHLFSLFQEAFYKKDLDKIHQIAMLKDALIAGKLYTFLQKCSGPENVLLYHIGEFIRTTHMSSITLFGLIDAP